MQGAGTPDDQESGSKPLAAELCALEPPDGIPLACDDFGLPNESYRHDAHRDNANRDDKSFLCFGNGDTKGASNPRHGKRSPSTRPLRCGPHARLAGRRDTASRLKCSQLKGQFGARQNLFIDFENSQLQAAGPDERICFWDLPSEKGAVAGYIFSGGTQDFPLTVSTILSHASAEPRSISRNRAGRRSALGSVLEPELA
jgi:hypothetical protein